MFKLNGNLKFINISPDYIRALNKVCSEVYYKSEGYENKPYVGILINEDNKSYVIPLTSAKNKHKKWKNVNQECYLLYEYALKSEMNKTDIWTETSETDKVKHILSMIDVKKMIPVKTGVYSITNINKGPSDTENIKKYKDLLNKEYIFCLKIIDDLIRKADKLYESQMTTGKVKKFCCDFKALEEVCNKYVV